jgi:hypothetical protein
MDGTGALLIADDAGNTVWRVAAADGSITPQPVPTDRVTAEAGAAPQNAAGTAPVLQRSNAPAAGERSAPPQTDIAPAIGPEDGAGASGGTKPPGP